MPDFDPTQGPRLAPAWNAALKILTDREWRPWNDVVTAMTNASNIQPKTADSLLYDATTHGHIQRKGRRRDTRQVRLTTAGADRWLTA